MDELEQLIYQESLCERCGGSGYITDPEQRPSQPTFINNCELCNPHGEK